MNKIQDKKAENYRMRIGAIFALVIALLWNAGCLSPAVLGTIETTGSTTPVVINHIGRGQSEGFFIAKFGTVISATLRAAEALSLEVNEKKVNTDQAKFSFHDATKDRIDIQIVRRSETMTSIKFDVGWFGSVAFSRLMMRQIISELHRSESFQQDLKPK